MKKRKQPVFYLHTIDGMPAFYEQGTQICYINSYGKPAPLSRSLDEIRKQQRASTAWRRKQGYGDDSKSYGYRRVTLPSGDEVDR